MCFSCVEKFLSNKQGGKEFFYRQKYNFEFFFPHDIHPLRRVVKRIVIKLIVITILCPHFECEEKITKNIEELKYLFTFDKLFSATYADDFSNLLN